MLGVGNSAHDIAQDLHGHGAKVKMIQRGSITVFSVKAASLNHAIYYAEGLSLEDADLIASSNTFPVLLRGYQLGTQRMLEIDEALRYIPPGKLILDVGCGNGYSTAIFARQAEHVLAIDYSEAMIARAKREYGATPNITFEVRDILVRDNPAGRDENGDRLANDDDLSWNSNIFLSLNLSFFLPAHPPVSP